MACEPPYIMINFWECCRFRAHLRKPSVQQNPMCYWSWCQCTPSRHEIHQESLQQWLYYCNFRMYFVFGGYLPKRCRNTARHQRQLNFKELLLLDDSYTAPVALKKVIKTKFVKRKGPRRFKSGLVKQDRAETKELRYLPPERMKDYYNNMMLAQHPEGLCELLSGTWMMGLSGCFSCFPLNLIEV